MVKSEFEFRMWDAIEPHLWSGDIDLREISYEPTTKTILFKADGTNNKTNKREQIQFHMNKYFSEELITGILAAYRKLEEHEKTFGD